MELYLQQGARMMDLCSSMIARWGGGTTILSPRDLNEGQLRSFPARIKRSGGKVLCDSQFYAPHATHETLRSHIYWPGEYESGMFWSNEGIRSVLSTLLPLNQELACDRIVLPGLFAKRVDEDWLDRQHVIVKEALEQGAEPASLVATIALSYEAILDIDQIHDVLDAAEEWAVAGAYLLFEHPRGEYCVTNPEWFANVLDLVAGLRLDGKAAIVGYADPQMLIAACASATAIASGVWGNVRRFSLDKFRSPAEAEPFVPSPDPIIWYYAPSTLSEFTMQNVSVAIRQNLSSTMAIPASYGETPASSLFTNSKFSAAAAGFGQRESFTHYLQCLHHQAANARKETFDATLQAYEVVLSQAEQALDELHKVRITGQERDFKRSIDAQRTALSLLQTERGAILRRRWSSI